MKRSDFLKSMATMFAAPSLLTAMSPKNSANKTAPILFPTSNKTIGMTDILSALRRYEPFQGLKTRHYDASQNGSVTKYGNYMQVFRETIRLKMCDASSESRLQERFELHKTQVDLAMLHSRNAKVYFDIDDSFIQTTRGLDSYCEIYGSAIDSGETGLKFFEEIINHLIYTKSPREQLLVSKRKCHDYFMSPILDNSSRLKSHIPQSGLFATMQYGGFKFHIAAIDNCDTDSSYILPMDKVKLNTGEFVYKFAGRYAKYTRLSALSNAPWYGWQTSDGRDVTTDFITTQCLDIIGATNFTKINHTKC